MVDQPNIQRRTLLSAIGVGLTGLSGCTGTADQPNGSASNGSSSNGTTSNGSKGGVNECRNQSNGSESTADSSEGPEETEGPEKTEGTEETNGSEENKESKENKESEESKESEETKEPEENKESEETNETNGSETEGPEETGGSETNGPEEPQGNETDGNETDGNETGGNETTETHKLRVQAKWVAPNGNTYHGTTTLGITPNPYDRSYKVSDNPIELPEGTYQITTHMQVSYPRPGKRHRVSGSKTIVLDHDKTATVVSNDSVDVDRRGEEEENETGGSGSGLNMGVGRGDEGGSTTPSILSGLLRS